MLVLTRRPGEVIELPQYGVRFVILAHNGHAARIGIEAPRDVLILREEVRREAESEERKP